MPVDYLGYVQAEQGKDPLSSLVRGTATGTALQKQDTELEKEQLGLQQYKAQQAALKGYAQTGDAQAAMQQDPITGMALQDRQRKVIADSLTTWDKVKWGTYNNLDHYNNVVRPEMLKSGAPASMFPEFKDVQSLNEFIPRAEMFAARIKQMGLNVHLKPGDYYRDQSGQMQQVPWGEPSPVQQSTIRKNEATAANQEADRLDPTRRHVEPTTTVLNQDGTVKTVVKGRALLEKPPKGSDPDVIKDKIEKDVRTGFKLTGEVATGFRKQAEAEVFKDKTFPIEVPAKWSKGEIRSQTKQVSFSEVPGEMKGTIRDQYKDQIAAKSRELYEAEVQKRVDAKFGQRQKHGGGAGPPLPTQYMGKYGTDSAGNNIVWDGTKYVPFTGE